MPARLLISLLRVPRGDVVVFRQTDVVHSIGDLISGGNREFFLSATDVTRYQETLNAHYVMIIVKKVSLKSYSRKKAREIIIELNYEYN